MKTKHLIKKRNYQKKERYCSQTEKAQYNKNVNFLQTDRHTSSKLTAVSARFLVLVRRCWSKGLKKLNED